MVKVSITLPNNAQITFEAEEPEDLHEIVGMVLRDLPRDLIQAGEQVNGQGDSLPLSRRSTIYCRTNAACFAVSRDALTGPHELRCVRQECAIGELLHAAPSD